MKKPETSLHLCFCGSILHTIAQKGNERREKCCVECSRLIASKLVEIFDHQIKSFMGFTLFLIVSICFTVASGFIQYANDESRAKWELLDEL